MQQHAKTEWFNHTHMPAIAIFPIASIPFTEITHTVFQKVTSAIEEKKKSAVMDSHTKEIQKALYPLKHDQREGRVIFYRARSVFKSCDEYSWDIVFHYLALASKMPTHTQNKICMLIDMGVLCKLA